MKKVLVSFVAMLFFLSGVFSQNKTPSSLSDTTKLDEVVVTGSRIPVSRSWVSSPISVIDRQLIENSNEISIIPVLNRQIPGLFITSRGVAGYGVSTGSAGTINIRGFSGSSGRVLILIDGHPQYATIYGHPIADAYISSEIERVEVSRGAASVLYGSNAMGGAINLITKKITQNGYNLKLNAAIKSYGTQQYSISNSLKKKRFSGYLGANFESTDGHRPNSEYNSLNGFAKAGYKIGDSWEITGNVSLTNFYAENPGAETKPMYESWVDVTRGMAGLSISNDYGMTSGSLNLFHNWGVHKINDGYYDGGTPQPYLFHSTDYMSGFNLYQAFKPFTGTTITGGIDLMYYGGNAYRNPETEIYADHIKLNQKASYLFLQQKFWKLMMNAGLRVENHNLYGNKWVPQTGFSFEATKTTNLKLSLSKGFRTPNMRELYMYAVANEDLLPEESISYDLSMSQKMLKNKLVAELSLYYTEGSNIIEVVAIEGVRQNRNAGEFANKGVELNLSYRILDNLTVSGNYSHLNMSNIITGAPINKLYLTTEYKPGKFTISVDAQAVDKLYLSTGNDPITSNYVLMDLKVNWSPNNWSEFFIKGENLLNTEYYTMVGFPMPGITLTGGLSLNIKYIRE